MSRKTERLLLASSWSVVLVLAVLVLLRERPASGKHAAAPAPPSELTGPATPRGEPSRTSGESPRTSGESPRTSGEPPSEGGEPRQPRTGPAADRPSPFLAGPMHVEGDAISLSTDGALGMTLDQFVLLGKGIMGKDITYRVPASWRLDPMVRLAGSATVVRRRRFFSFFSAVFHAKGYDCAARREGEAVVVDIVPMAPEDLAGIDARPLRFVSFDELQVGSRKGDARDASESHGKASDEREEGGRDGAGLRILTAIPLDVAAGIEVRLQLRRYFANLESGLGVWHTTDPDGGEEMILCGTAEDVAKAAKLIERLDRRRPPR